ncbi:hypothetical protein [Shinella zoogloeoides]|uniref:hypothetical protein n=1 Tax=Shinella zoogloeoides TaxID=352475 RepID=UPI00273EC6FD|nr:hypothetical protein [Shinella zoogloeoides]WLR90969.1 hypothetical protein Q9316_00025 [Shinella zoogloeoides]
MFELILMTLVGAPGASPAIESQAIEVYETAAECTEAATRFPIRKIQLPTGQTLTLKLACERRK